MSATRPPERRAQRRAAARERAKQRARARVRRRRRLAQLPGPVRSPLVWLVVLAVAGSGTAYGVWRQRRPIGLPPEPAPLASRLASYRVVYEMRDTAGSKELVRTEIVTNRRPFDNRIETRGGPPPGGDIELASVTNRDYLWNLKAKGEVNFGIKRQPGGSPRDASIDALRAAAGAGAAQERGTRRVAGRRCTVFRHKDTRPEPLAPPGEKDHVDTCVSEDGIVLGEVWTIKGRVVSRRTAVEVESSPALDDALFLIGKKPEDDPNYPTFAPLLESRSVQDDKEPERPALHPELPDGFRRDRKAMDFEGGAGGSAPRNSYFESYVRGQEVVVVDQGTMSVPSPPWSSDAGEPLNLGRRWQARILRYEDRVELRRWRVDPEDEETDFYRVQAPTEDLAVWFMLTLR